ncbi:lipopolysaccharide biosynthesis protein RfbH [bacterium]|nr:lipopolysaccharide biosynthesis protein RfbH [bacterium]
MEKFLRNTIKVFADIYFKLIIKNKKRKNYFPASGKVLDEKDLKNLIDASLDMWLTAGRFNQKFEKEFAKYLNVKYALTTTSGSSANLLAISALTSPKLGERALKKGDEVITVAAGFPTTINAIVQNGLVPVFLDSEIGTYNIDVSQIENAITDKTKAIITAHTLGNMFEISKIKEICEKHDLWLIEDSCDALGAEYKGQKAGTIGDIGTFSFYPAHHITMGEGGCVVTNNKDLKKIIQSFRDWGRDCECPTGCDNVCGKRFSQQFGKLPFGYDHKYTYSHLGYNLKITDMQAAIGLSQLEKLPKFLKQREKNAKYLMKKLADLKEFLILPKVTENTKSSWFGFLISVKENQNFTKQELIEYLEKNGVGTRQLFAGNILRQPMFTENSVEIKINNSSVLISDKLAEEDYKKLPNTEFIMNNTFWVGIYPALGKKELSKTSDLIHKFVEEKK